MGAPLSQDLRHRILDALRDGMTQMDVALRFKVSSSSVQRILKLFNETGSVLPKKMGGSRRRTLDEHKDLIRDIIDEKPDATMSEMSQKLSDYKVYTSPERLRNFVRKSLQFSYKKKSHRDRTKEENSTGST